MKKIIIDTRIITQELTGIGRYTYEIVKGLIQKNDVELLLLTNDILFIKNIFGKSNKISYIEMKSKFLSPFEVIELPLIINRYKKHIFFTPSFSCSPFITIKSYITIHDLNHIRFPQYYSKFHQYYYRYIVKPFALKCKNIFTVSNFSKEEIFQWIDCDWQKVIVAYNGIDERYKVIKDKNILEKVKIKYNLPDKFVMYVGNLKPHKNINVLLRAMKDVDNSLNLVINGTINNELQEIIHRYNLEKRVNFIGYIDELDLPVLYNLSEIFVYPSLYEGFGLPPLEAMACGTKTIVSNTSSLKEVVGDGAIKFAADDSIQLSQFINELYTNKSEDLIIKGIQQASYFKWENTVNSIYQFLN